MKGEDEESERERAKGCVDTARFSLPPTPRRLLALEALQTGRHPRRIAFGRPQNRELTALGAFLF